MKKALIIKAFLVIPLGLLYFFFAPLISQKYVFWFDLS